MAEPAADTVDTVGTVGTVDEPTLPTDDELTALALAGDPDAPLPADAVPYVADPEGSAHATLLPGWYMPAPVSVTRTPVRTVAAIAVVAGLVLINVLGLCITYGSLTAG